MTFVVRVSIRRAADGGGLRHHSTSPKEARKRMGEWCYHYAAQAWQSGTHVHLLGIRLDRHVQEETCVCSRWHPAFMVVGSTLLRIVIVTLQGYNLHRQC